mmetsp:Transcript_12668/g.58546  ORF Transcript_12668/g.58546 Transcript_12668/m.58546 type:complete len:250 (+) Transcript_12668:219-968(+)
MPKFPRQVAGQRAKRARRTTRREHACARVPTVRYPEPTHPALQRAEKRVPSREPGTPHPRTTRRIQSANRSWRLRVPPRHSFAPVPPGTRARVPDHLPPADRTSLASPPSSKPAREGQKSRRGTPVAISYRAWRNPDTSAVCIRRAPARSRASVCDRTPSGRSSETPSRRGRCWPRAAPCEGIRIHRREAQSRNRGHHRRVTPGRACPGACLPPRRPSHPLQPLRRPPPPRRPPRRSPHRRRQRRLDAS